MQLWPDRADPRSPRAGRWGKGGGGRAGLSGATAPWWPPRDLSRDAPAAHGRVAPETATCRARDGRPRLHRVPGSRSEARGPAVPASCSLQAPRGLCLAPVPASPVVSAPHGPAAPRIAWPVLRAQSCGHPRTWPAQRRRRGNRSLWPWSGRERAADTGSPAQGRALPGVHLSFPWRSPAARPRSAPHATPLLASTAASSPSLAEPTSPCATGGRDVGGGTLSEGNPGRCSWQRKLGNTPRPPRPDFFRVPACGSLPASHALASMSSHQKPF